ncbi:hypothetical protein SUGI_0533420 [Cryptomeria japonica]|uniref:pathogenesis-related protein PR-1-like n=1 Tax=Cryptomeria japonica TaxID=3369 RepID=UPI002408A581|nr:pathogenesis-related protein PR-1-like [Cryptomeria japonica]GLJ27206.1 hypothetical protein SUGI_0533420 [Cryptomeria japonica]
MKTALALWLLAGLIVSIANASRPLQKTPGNSNLESYNGGGGARCRNNSECMAFMKMQNSARAEVGENALAWDHKVESYARWWADQRREDCELMHSGGPYGENIFWGSGSDWTPLDAVQDWLEEKEYYNYESNSCENGEMCGHYTHIVWNETQVLGCARVVCYSGDVFMTCNYHPPGNYIGQRPY